MQFFKNILLNFHKYSFLLKQLIMRDFKVKYKRSFLGVVWSLLYPVLMMIVMAVVFSQMFKVRVEGINYLVYLMSGLVVFNYFNEASSTAMASVVTNFPLMNKVYIPKYIFPLGKCLFVGINFALTLIPLLFVILFTGNADTRCTLNLYYLILPLIYACLIIFTIGIGFILSCVSVFIRDMFYIYGIIITIWNYLTPIFYSVEILPNNLQKLMNFNPLYVFINSTRDIILYGKAPSGTMLISCVLFALIFLIIGIFIFKRKQDEFIYYV